MSAPPSPDCRLSKHGACDGGSWDNALDAPADCPCICHVRDRGDSSLEFIILVLFGLVIAGLVLEHGVPVALDYLRDGASWAAGLIGDAYNFVKGALL